MKSCRVTFRGKEYEVKSGMLLTELIRKEKIDIDLSCGGMGRCGKCRVRFSEGAPQPTSADKRLLAEEDIAKGIRLSCRAVITGDAVVDDVFREGDSGEISAVTEKLKEGMAVEIPAGEKDSVEKRIEEGSGVNVEGALPGKTVEDDRDYAAAVDIGTTTIAAALIDTKAGTAPIRTAVTMNHQRTFGADVISRIKAAGDGSDSEMRRLVQDDINSLIRTVSEGAGIKRVVLAGNTTMLHLLTGDSCEGLGRAPYKPVRLSYPEIRYDELFKDIADKVVGDSAKCSILPMISAFVGADIVAGMYELSFHDIPEGRTYMLIDLGTNGEMAVADSEKITVCSTAAGPVFEGGGISCGMAGVDGAIGHISIKDSGDGYDISFETIGGGKPLGICGSGVMEIVSELVRTGMADSSGTLLDSYFDEGVIVFDDDKNKIVFTQADIRAVQLAKAAIRSGIDTLLAAHGCSASDVDRVYLAGGFSEHLDMDKIRYLKLLPQEFLDRKITRSVGNTSLKGCIKALCDEKRDKALMTIVSRSQEISLAGEDAFGEAFISEMNF